MNMCRSWKIIDNNQGYWDEVTTFAGREPPQAGHHLTCCQALSDSLPALLEGFVTSVVSCLSQAIPARLHAKILSAAPL